jgi:hypothetical protein
LRYSLRTFLLVVVVIGAIVALDIRQRYFLHRFHTHERLCAGYKVSACWDWHFGKAQLVYLFVKIPKRGSSISTSFGGTWRTRPIKQGLAKLPIGLFLDGNFVPRSDQGHVWTYHYASHEVVQIDNSSDRIALTPDDFWQLERTELWRTQILPFVEREAKLNNE